MRLINVDAASEIVRFECGKWEGLANTIIKEFYAIKPVDAVPVRHGRWKTVEDWDGDEHYQCSVCGAEFVLIDGDPDDNDYLYCPHCGAKMDGKDGEQHD